MIAVLIYHEKESSCVRRPCLRSLAVTSSCNYIANGLYSKLILLSTSPSFETKINKIPRFHEFCVFYRHTCSSTLVTFALKETPKSYLQPALWPADNAQIVL